MNPEWATTRRAARKTPRDMNSSRWIDLIRSELVNTGVLAKGLDFCDLQRKEKKEEI